MGSDPRNGEVFMSYAIIGFGKIGQALAKAFARSGITTTLHDPGSVNASSGTAKLAPYRESHRTTIRLKV
jgi:predicted dinucleotide-binding enzyme